GSVRQAYPGGGRRGVHRQPRGGRAPEDGRGGGGGLRQLLPRPARQPARGAHGPARLHLAPRGRHPAQRHPGRRDGGDARGGAPGGALAAAVPRVPARRVRRQRAGYVQRDRGGGREGGGAGGLLVLGLGVRRRGAPPDGRGPPVQQLHLLRRDQDLGRAHVQESGRSVRPFVGGAALHERLRPAAGLQGRVHRGDDEDPGPPGPGPSPRRVRGRLAAVRLRARDGRGPRQRGRAPLRRERRVLQRGTRHRHLHPRDLRVAHPPVGERRRHPVRTGRTDLRDQPRRHHRSGRARPGLPLDDRPGRGAAEPDRLAPPGHRGGGRPPRRRI
ncbi:MAG: UDP-glucose 4-epimerase, partial [uncultured Gemmatimonadetes bacterium]